MPQFHHNILTWSKLMQIGLESAHNFPKKIPLHGYRDEEYGYGLGIDQNPRHLGLDEDMLIAYEEGVCVGTDGVMLLFNNEGSPERVAAMMIGLIVSGVKLVSPTCHGDEDGDFTLTVNDFIQLPQP